MSDFNNEKIQVNEGMLDAMEADLESFKAQHTDFMPLDRTLSDSSVAQLLWRKWLNV